MTVLSTEGLSKNYGAVRALRDVSIEVPSGSVFGILGPNGSGKTTFLGTVLEILYPSAGRFRWFDEANVPTAAQRHRIGTLLETPNYYPYLSGADNLAITASIRGCETRAIGPVLERVGLREAGKKPFSSYSLGMKQRLAIGGALLGDPEVLVLDEPTNGLDPAGIADVRGLIGRLREEGQTIILASHLLDEVEKVCSHVAILKKGRLLQTGPMEHVLSEDPIIEVGGPDPKALEEALKGHEPALTVTPHEAGFRVSGPVRPEQLNRYCFERGLTLSLLRTNKKTLESRFLEITDE